MIEGLPGVGLVGKLAADHLVETFEMTHYANVHCEHVPPVAVYAEGDPELTTPVRLYADEERDLVVLQSDVPLSPTAARSFADCLDEWLVERDALPIYLSGVGRDLDDEVPDLYGVASGDAAALLDDAGIDAPTESGLISGPTGALLSHAIETGRTAVGLVVESDPQFPDPAAARVLIRDGIAPLADVDVPTDDLVEHAEEIRAAKERLAERMREAEESTEAQPLRMYQ
jgi:uncharacterized protein